MHAHERRAIEQGAKAPRYGKGTVWSCALAIAGLGSLAWVGTQDPRPFHAMQTTPAQATTPSRVSQAANHRRAVFEARRIQIDMARGRAVQRSRVPTG